jgi:predicted dehydrogenase
MKDNESPSTSAIVNRRSFVKTTAVAGALITSKTRPAHAQSTPPSEQINVGLIGCGSQGIKQVESIIGKSPIEGINFVAVCDIWERAATAMYRRLMKYGHELRQYATYEEMLEKEKDMDAVLIASPDFVHHVHTRACLEAGMAVYCEKMMSNTLEGASDMVRAQRETDGILQIGHQRRSNPRYKALRDQLVFGEEAFGRITHASAQWNRGTAAGTIPVPKKEKLWVPQEILNANGFDDPNLSWEEQMYRFRNWRLFRKFGGGVISDLGAHQIDIFNWFFGTTPKSVVASGGVDYYMDSELYDNVMTIYEYDTPKGVSRGYYQVLTTTSSLGFFERFMGDQGTVSISEIPKVNQAYREANAEPWDHLLEKRLMVRDQKDIKYNPWDIPKTWGEKAKPWVTSTKKGEADSRASKELEAWELATQLEELPHTPHLRNFFDVVRSGKKEDLNCSVDEGFKTCVTVLKIYDAISQGIKVEFSPEDFVA